MGGRQRHVMRGECNTTYWLLRPPNAQKTPRHSHYMRHASKLNSTSPHEEPPPRSRDRRGRGDGPSDVPLDPAEREEEEAEREGQREAPRVLVVEAERRHRVARHLVEHGVLGRR
eukprot:scaffold28110_cov71-Phaeocystis_antarctica.AAC.7